MLVFPFICEDSMVLGHQILGMFIALSYLLIP